MLKALCYAEKACSRARTCGAERRAPVRERWGCSTAWQSDPFAFSQPGPRSLQPLCASATSPRSLAAATVAPCAASETLQIFPITIRGHGNPHRGLCSEVAWAPSPADPACSFCAAQPSPRSR